MNSNKFYIRIKRTWFLLFMLLFLISGSSCRKFVEIPPPPGIITEGTVYSSDATAISVLTAIYASMNTSPIQGGGNNGSISLYAGLASDEYTVNGNTTFKNCIAYYQNALSQSSPSNLSGGEHWTQLYAWVFKCNAAIEGLSSSNANTLTPAVRNQLLGEAKFLRAFFYFYLVNEFGDVPLAITTDPQINTLLSRTPKAIVYEQIIADLKDAEGLMSENFLAADLLSTSAERVRPTRWAAAALLARVYLYLEKYQEAEEQATLVINKTSLFGPIAAVSLNSVFLKNSREAIWQIQPTSLNINTVEAVTLIIQPTGPRITDNPVYLNKNWLNNFETNDQRKVFGNWVDTTIYTVSTSPMVRDTIMYPYKYKVYSSTGVNNIAGITEYFMVLRLAEQYLIRAEARAQLGNIGGAQADLNSIRNRAGLGNIPAGDKQSLLTAILRERQVELFSEWGHRWFDLKRTGKIDEVMSVVTPIKAPGTVWQSYQQLYPIPYIELQRAPNLTQNVGY